PATAIGPPRLHQPPRRAPPAPASPARPARPRHPGPPPPPQPSRPGRSDPAPAPRPPRRPPPPRPPPPPAPPPPLPPPPPTPHPPPAPPPPGPPRLHRAAKILKRNGLISPATLPPRTLGGAGVTTRRAGKPPSATNGGSDRPVRRPRSGA